jgi:hypothetical protein
MFSMALQESRSRQLRSMSGAIAKTRIYVISSRNLLEPVNIHVCCHGIV